MNNLNVFQIYQHIAKFDGRAGTNEGLENGYWILINNFKCTASSFALKSAKFSAFYYSSET